MDIEGTSLDGTTFDWDAYRGKVVLMVFWEARRGSWEAQAPEVRTYHALYRDVGFEVVVISLDRDPQTLVSALEREPSPWAIVRAKDGQDGHSTAIHYGIAESPVFFLVDQDGKVVSTDARGESLRSLLEQLLGSKQHRVNEIWKAQGEEGPVDLLKLIDLQRDPVTNGWALDQGCLLSPEAEIARIRLPLLPPEEYTITLVIEPVSGHNTLVMGLLATGNQFIALLDFDAGEEEPLSALEQVDGHKVFDQENKTVYRGQAIKDGSPTTIVCTVRKDYVSVESDGKTIIHFEGDHGRLSPNTFWQIPQKGLLFLGSYDCRYRFSKIELTPIWDHGSQQSAGSTEPDRPDGEPLPQPHLEGAPTKVRSSQVTEKSEEEGPGENDAE